MAYYPVPGGLPANLTLPVTPHISDTNLDLNTDSDSAWAEVIQRDTEKSFGDPTITTEPDILDEKSLVPFLRDYRVHGFLSEHSRDECLSLYAMEGRKVSPRPLRRLYSAASVTFLADCVMALNMNPAVRKLIMHNNNLYVADPHDVASLTCFLGHLTASQRSSRSPRLRSQRLCISAWRSDFSGAASTPLSRNLRV